MKLNNSNISVTGVSGFAGSYVAKYRLNQAAKVFGLVRRRADGTPLLNLEYLCYGTDGFFCGGTRGGRTFVSRYLVNNQARHYVWRLNFR